MGDMTENSEHLIDVSIIIPIYNGCQWMKSCFISIMQQTAREHLNLEVCVCNDASNDNTAEDLIQWENTLKDSKIDMKIYTNTSGTPIGVGYAKNKCVGISRGEYLCFQDIDDVMQPNRILSQYNSAKSLPNHALLGSQFIREPEDSTIRYTKWANTLSETQLNKQIYTSHGPTIVMPTWFCHKEVFHRVGGFNEDGKGTPEDLIFFYKHLDNNGIVVRVDENLLTYRYHLEATTFSIKKETIWEIRLEHLEKHVLSKWKVFTIWNAGKQGRQFYNCLSKTNKDKVIAFCDVDIKKINRKYTPYYPTQRKCGKSVDILHFKDAQAPFVICVKQDLTQGNFENNLDSLHLKEDRDYVFFS